MKKIFILPLFILFTTFVSAQSLDSLNTLVEEYYYKGDYLSATIAAEKALEKCMADSGKENSTYAGCLDNVATLYRLTGRYNEAVPIYKESAELKEILFGNNSYEFARTLNYLSILFTEMGEYENALDNIITATRIVKKAKGEDSKEYGTYLNNLAHVYSTIGHIDRAVELYEKALKNTEKTVGKEHQSYGVALSNLASTLNELGKYERANELLIKAMQNTAKSMGKKHPDYGIRLNNLASLYQSLGRYEESIPLFEEALENCDSSLGRDHVRYGILLNNLAVSYERIHQYSKALELHKQSLENTISSVGKKHHYYAIRLNSVGVTLKRMGRTKEALPYFEESVNCFEEVIGKEHETYGKLVRSYGELLYETGNYKTALKLANESLSVFTKIAGENHPQATICRNFIGDIYTTLGEYDKAHPIIKKANAESLEQINSVFAFSAEIQKKKYYSTVRSSFEKYQSFMVTTRGKYKDFSGMLYNNQLILKGQLLAESKAMLQSVLANPDSSIAEKYKSWIGIRRQLSKEYNMSLENRSTKLDSLEKKAVELESELVKISKSFGEKGQKKVVKWQEIRDKLKENEIAIEFSRFRYFNKTWTDSVYYAAYVITHNCESPEMVLLFEESDFLKLSEGKSPAQLYDTRGLKVVSSFRNKSLNKQLYYYIFKPLEEYLNKSERIYFAADGNLHQIAFAAIKDNEDNLLCRKYDLIQLNSTGQIVINIPQPAKEPAMLAGGINFEYSGVKDSAELSGFNFFLNANRSEKIAGRGRGSSWKYLQGTKEEVELLKELYKQNDLEVTTLTEGAATEESIKELDGNSPKILHLATHGFFFENAEAGVESSKIIDNVYTLANDPLMRAGLVFAGANFAWKNGGNPYETEDGILSAYEISNLNLSNTDLVVLSACETGLGDIEGSEGVYGLQRAFRMAGVNYLIMSLWSVPDKETVEFMEVFYSQWLKDKTIREAFSSAQIIMSEKYREEPDKWAAFILVE